MTITEQKIGGYSGVNAPGVLNLYVIDRKEVLSVLDPARHRIPGGAVSVVPAGGVVLNRGAMITKMKFPPLQCSYIQTMERTDGGLISKPVIEFQVPASRKDLIDFYNVHYQKQFVCLVEDANRQAYIMGNEERGLRMQLSQSVNSVNTHLITFSGSFANPSFLLETSAAGLVLADHFRDTDFSIDFSLDFNA
ncbi:hypothetical protein [Dyadobacter sp. LHD-138]|uniref:hypothetical protein n=1 Tax=Dyadobacter sp. LHD-138 TaxID=3071413 RepID=UPI0027E0808F|nr:hypothetical protein [Dyadobacter sp. LHD-138]MDQ6479816.1 hypothetical protein [Dyadobacter sp. LHD-138]